MKYGPAFAILAVVISIYAIVHGGWFYVLLWPAVSFALVAAAYLGAGSSVFGKRPNGTLPLVHSILLAPFLLYLSLVWHFVRFFSREPAFNQLTDSMFIGRRLLSHERPSNFDHIVDLTCEFNEPIGLRSSGYISFPTLDAHFPSADELRKRAALIAQLDGTVYIHCAQGHGRTATLAIAYLLHIGHSKSIDEAVQYVLQRRPHADLGRSQLAMLRRFKKVG